MASNVLVSSYYVEVRDINRYFVKIERLRESLLRAFGRIDSTISVLVTGLTIQDH